MSPRHPYLPAIAACSLLIACTSIEFDANHSVSGIEFEVRQISTAEEYDTGVFSVYQAANVTANPQVPTEWTVDFEQYPSAFLWRGSDDLPTEELWLFPDDDEITRFVAPSEDDDEVFWRIEYLQDGQNFADLNAFRDYVIEWYGDNASITIDRDDLQGLHRHIVIAPQR